MLKQDQVQAIRKIVATDDAIPLLFNALSDTGRYRIFKILLQEQGVCVTDIANILQVSLPAISQQLRIMELSGLIRRTRHGQKTCYTIKSDSPHVKHIIKFITIYS